MTKFGERLDAEAVPAWREHYVRYTHLKRLLKAIVSRLSEEARASDPRLGQLGSAALPFTPPKHLTHLSLSFQEVRPGSKPGTHENDGGEGEFFREHDPDDDRVRAHVESELASLERIVQRLDADVADAARRGLPDLAARSDAELRRDAVSFDTTSSSSSDGGAGPSRSSSVDLEAGAVDPESANAMEAVETLRDKLHEVQDAFLRVEKFANLNTTAVYKILKKHDKLLPHTTCCRYYLERLHAQPWIRGDHSAVFVVQIADLFARLRGSGAAAAARATRDGERSAQGSGPKGGEGVQDFVRTTKKYWVATEDVSEVKNAIAQRLPVFLMERERDPSASVPADSQMTNSVYLDNVQLGLYHSRITKQPHAIAVRLRWYGTDPEAGKVFVERKTHRESWTGEESVKERFALPHALVAPFLRGEHRWEDEERRLAAEARAKKRGGAANASDDPGDADDEKARAQEAVRLAGTRKLFEEVQKAVESKQLEPKLRTAYMRTAFQVPHDASVRCSLDTSLAMIDENPSGYPTCAQSNRWYRDPAAPLRRTEMTRFPHAILEIKLALEPGEETPAWVADLVRSGALTEVHKFSKFMHGCAVLFPDVAQEVPYWVDDVSLRHSIQQAAAEATGATTARSPRQSTNARARAPETAAASLDGDELTHPLLAPSSTRDAGALDLIGDERSAARERRREAESAAFATDDSERRLFPGPLGVLLAAAGSAGRRVKGFLSGEDDPRRRSDGSVPRTVPMRIEPKTYFANERTFLSWLHTAVLIGTIGAGLASMHVGAPSVRRAAARSDGSASAADDADASSPVLGRGVPATFTVVHRHEYAVTFPGGASVPLGGGGGGALGDAFTPLVSATRAGGGEVGGGGGPSTAEVEAAVSNALAEYLAKALGGPAPTETGGGGGGGGVGGVASEDAAVEVEGAGLAIAMTMLCASVLLCAYATYTFVWRGRMISKRSTVPFHDPVGPVVMGSVMIGAMVTLIVISAAKASGAVQ